MKACGSFNTTCGEVSEILLVSRGRGLQLEVSIALAVLMNLIGCARGNLEALHCCSFSKSKGISEQLGRAKGREIGRGIFENLHQEKESVRPHARKHDGVRNNAKERDIRERAAL